MAGWLGVARARVHPRAGGDACRPDPQEDPARNQADAEREAELEIQLNS